MAESYEQAWSRPVLDTEFDIGTDGKPSAPPNARTEVVLPNTCAWCTWYSQSYLRWKSTAGDAPFSNPLYGNSPGATPRRSGYTPHSNPVWSPQGEHMHGQAADVLLLPAPPPAEQLPLPAPHTGETLSEAVSQLV